MHSKPSYTQALKQNTRRRHALCCPSFEEETLHSLNVLPIYTACGMHLSRLRCRLTKRLVFMAGTISAPTLSNGAALSLTPRPLACSCQQGTQAVPPARSSRVHWIPSCLCQVMLPPPPAPAHPAAPAAASRAPELQCGTIGLAHHVHSQCSVCAGLTPPRRPSNQRPAAGRDAGSCGTAARGCLSQCRDPVLHASPAWHLHRHTRTTLPMSLLRLSERERVSCSSFSTPAVGKQRSLFTTQRRRQRRGQQLPAPLSPSAP